MSLLQIAFVLLAAVAAGGVLMAVLIAAKAKFPSFLGMGHGLAALASIGVLFAACVKGPATPPFAWWALGVFVSGLVGGLIFFRVLFPGRAPLLLALAHGSLGGVGLWLLYGAAF